MIPISPCRPSSKGTSVIAGVAEKIRRNRWQFLEIAFHPGLEFLAKVFWLGLGSPA